MTLYTQKHVEYILSLDNKESLMTQHLRLNGIYWATTCLAILGFDGIDKEKVVNEVLACQKPNGGFGGNKDHDAHLLYTLSAVQILFTFNQIELIDKKLVMNCTFVLTRY